MKVAVVGAGAIGAYVGAALNAGGVDVTLIARGPHLRAMQTEGVRVLSPRGDFIAHPEATDDLDAIGDADVVFWASRPTASPEMAPRLGAAMRPDAAVVCAQNGIPYWYFHNHGGPLEGTTLESVDPGGIIARSLRPESAIGCVVYCATEIVEPGVIRHVEGTRFAICEPDGSRSERCEAISAAFRAGGLKAPIDAQLRNQIWLKLVGNAALNPVSALTGATLGEGAPARRHGGAAARAARGARPPWGRAWGWSCPFRWSGDSRPRSRSVTTGPRCSWTARPASRSSISA